jgi:hemoglobin-like flavoprotein
LASRSAELADRFFENLFTRQAAVRSLFPADVTEQKRQLPSAIQTLIENAQNPDKLEATLRELGKRYAAQGALPTHYATVARTFVDTVREMSGLEWQARYTRAWTSMFDAVSKTMVRGATGKGTPVAKTVATTRSTPVTGAKPQATAKPETSKKPVGGKGKRAA